jgi:hypothetical protein
MPRLKPGDEVLCRIFENTIVSPYDVTYDETRVFEIIGTDNSGYILFIPHYSLIKGTRRVDSCIKKNYGVNPRYTGDDCIYIQDNFIYKIYNTIDGCFCTRCNEFIRQAEENMEDGTFMCWSCRNYPDR